MSHLPVSLASRSTPRSFAVLATVVAALVASIVVPVAARAADVNATPSSLGSVYASAQGGDVIHLAAGSYGSFAGGSKASVVTLIAQSGAVASIAPSLGSGVNNLRFEGLTITDLYTNGARNTSFVNSRFTGPARVDTPANVTNANVVFDGVTFDGIDACGSCYEGRLTVRGYNNSAAVGVRIVNSHFGNGGCSDGVQIIGDAYGVQVGPGNEFSGLKQSGCAAHVDSIQLYGSSHTQIVGNYFHDDDTIIMAPDGGESEVISDNVMIGAGYVPAVQLGSHDGTQVVHNTVRDIQVQTGSKSGAPAGRNVVVQDNVFAQGASTTPAGGSGCPGCPVAYNLFASSNNASGSNSQVGAPVFTGGANPASYSGYALAANSPGKANASDGADRGIRAASSPPPPPDTTAPDTTITSGPTGTTNDSTPTFAFTASEANSVFECRVDSGSWVNCASPWTTSAQADGAHSVSVRATDVAGNTDASPATRAFTVDTAPAPDTTPPDTTITSGPAGTTTATGASFAFSSSESGSTFECKLDSAAFTACTSPKAYSALGTGSHSFSVRATDAAGNTDASPATQTWTIQTAPPPDRQPVAAYVYSPTAPTAGHAVSFDASSATCDDTPCTYSWADDGDDGPAGTQWPLGTGKTMTFTFQDAGVKNVRLVVTDADGDTNATMKAITVTAGTPADTTAPDTTITSGPNGTTSDNTPTFAFTATEAGSTFQCRVDSGSWATCTTPWTTAALADGAHSASVRATDAAGNVDASPATRSFTVATAPPPDTTAPDTTIGSGPNSATNDATPTFAFTATEAGSTFQCRVDAGAWASCTSPWTTPALSDGAHSVSVRATDAAGNPDASPATRSFSVDTQAPNTTISSAPPAISPGSSATLAFGASESGATFECQLDGGAWTACTSPKTYTGLSLGQHTAAVRATDPAGNVDPSVASATWTTVALPGLPGGATTVSGGSRSANQAPTVTLAAPAAGSTFTSTLSMTATASDDHGVRDVEFWVDGTRVSRDNTAPYAATFAARKTTAYGVHTVSVRAVDAAGQARSAAVTVTRVRLAGGSKRKPDRARNGRARAASASDGRQNVLVSVALWRVSSAPADGGGTLLRGRGIAEHSAAVSLARCEDGSGAVAVVMQMRAGSDGTLYALQPAEGLCVLRVQPLGDS
jgi:hypothetical protein